ncbi:MAG: alpha/beta fold hydrolase [Chryseolinea sp.]
MMRSGLILCSILMASLGCHGQQDKLKRLRCPCKTVGLDSLWAKANRVSCFKIPIYKSSVDPNAGTYSIGVVVAKSEVTTVKTPILYLHGGPGIATLDNLPHYLKQPTWKGLRRQHDLIFFDYRGTGSSEPELCNDLQDSLYAFAVKSASPQAFKEKEIALYANCLKLLKQNGVDLRTFSSMQLAADADEIRKQLQITKWNVYGVSFGTTVALNMLRNFSAGIRSVILDSPFPPNSPWNDFVRPFDASFKVLEKYVVGDPVTAKLFPAIRNDFVRAVTRLNAKPAQLSFKRGKNIVIHNYSGNDFAWSIWNALLKPKSIPFVPKAIKEVAEGNDEILQRWSDAFSDPDAYGKYSETQSRAILCFEGRPQNPEDTEASLSKNYPDFTSFNASYNVLVCDVWRPDKPDNDIFEPVVSELPVLILSGEYDPVCPPVFGELTAQSLSNSTLIIVPAASHAAIHADNCVRQIAFNFFLNPVVKPDVQCIKKRTAIKFLTSDLLAALKEVK